MDNNQQEQMRAGFEKWCDKGVFDVESKHDCPPHGNPYEDYETNFAYQGFQAGYQAATSTHAEQIKRLQDHIAELERMKLPPEDEAIEAMAAAIADSNNDGGGDIRTDVYYPTQPYHRIAASYAYRKLKQMIGEV